MPLHIILTVFRSKWYLISLITVAGALAGLAFGLLSPTRYVATADVAADPRSATSNGLSSMSPDDYDAFSEDLVYVAESGAVRDTAAAAGIPEDAVELEVSRVENTRVLRFQVLAPTPRAAVRAANSFAEAFLEVQRDRYVERGEQSARQLDAEVATLRQRVAALDVSLVKAVPESVAEDALSAERFAAAERLLSLVESQNDRRNAAALAAQGFDLAEPAQSAERAGRTDVQLVLGGGLLGLLAGSTLGALAVDRRNPVWDVSRLAEVVTPGASDALFDLTSQTGPASQSLVNHLVATGRVAGRARTDVLLLKLSASRGASRAVTRLLEALRQTGVRLYDTAEEALPDRAYAGSAPSPAPSRPVRSERSDRGSAKPALPALDVIQPPSLQESAEGVTEAARAHQTVLIVTQRDDRDDVRRAVDLLSVAGAQRLALVLVRA